MNIRKTILTLLITVIFSTTTGQSRYWQQQADYKINVVLNAENKMLEGNCVLTYKNNSPDTLAYIFLHLWSNAYKNDKTAFSEQMLKIGRTDFYFADEEKRGYINLLNTSSNNALVTIENDPLHEDIVKLILQEPILPGATAVIKTDFKEKLPFLFSRGGYKDNAFQVTQWYPKVAVYDKKGWHPLPYLDQGEFYSDFGSYNVQITAPEKYVIAATGEMIEKSRSEGNATWHFVQKNVIDFAWFANEHFILKEDTVNIENRIVLIKNYVLPESEDTWKSSLSYTKKAIKTKSEWLGMYPYDIVSVVQNVSGSGGGMEYPTITVLDAGNDYLALEKLINHEVGHNWFYGILATNERDAPWMDEGMNSYYDKRYTEQETLKINGNVNLKEGKNFLQRKLPQYPEKMIMQTLIHLQKDQPISTRSAAFSYLNYNLIAYEKAAEWMQLLEQEMGLPAFNKMMQLYYERWKFKHPTVLDFRAIVDEVHGKNTDHIFSLLDRKGPLRKSVMRTIKPTLLFNFKKTGRTAYVSLLPAAGYNYYDKVMLGAMIHNYNLPPTNLQFLAAPLYATGSKTLNGIGRISYSIFPDKTARKIDLSLGFSHFTQDNFKDSTGHTTYQPFSKITSAIRYNFGNTDPLSNSVSYLQFKNYLIRETGLLFGTDPITQKTIISYPQQTRFINQLTIGVDNFRALYPYNANLQVDQGVGFLRAGLTGNYFFNYPKGGGLHVRAFAGKFIYTGDKTSRTRFENDRYQLNLTGARGYEDYTYNNYFYGRNEFEGLASQQIVERDGAFKVRTDLLSNKVGKTDNWLAALNFNSSIPDKINPLSLLPVKIPVRIFFDVGTYAEAWDKKANSSRFLYDAGLQVSLFADVLNVYFPLLYSKVYRDYYKSIYSEKKFAKSISFSVNFKALQPRKLFPEIGL